MKFYHVLVFLGISLQHSHHAKSIFCANFYPRKWNFKAGILLGKIKIIVSNDYAAKSGQLAPFWGLFEQNGKISSAKRTTCTFDCTSQQNVRLFQCPPSSKHLTQQAFRDVWCLHNTFILSQTEYQQVTRAWACCQGDVNNKQHPINMHCKIL